MTRPTVIDTWETADRRQDLAVMRSLLAREVRLISPLTDAFAFEGPDEVMAVFESAFELLDDITIHKVTGADQDWALHGKATLGGHNLEEVRWLHLNDEGRIDEVTLFIRPLAAAAELLARIGPKMAARGLMGKRSAGAASFLAGMPAAQLRMAEGMIMPRLK